MADDRGRLNDDSLREAFLAEGRAAGAGHRCPPPERLWQAARAADGAGRAPHVIDHLAECGECAAAWRLARELDGEAAHRRGGGPPRISRGALLALAATLVCAALLGGLYVSGRTPLTDGLRPAALRGRPAEWLQPASGSDLLQRARCVLRWRAGPAGTFYDVHVLDVDLQPLARAFHLAEPRFTLSDEALAGLPPGAILLWQVTAQLPDGRRLQSATFSSRITD